MSRYVCPSCGGVVTGTRRVLIDDAVETHKTTCPGVIVVARSGRS